MQAIGVKPETSLAKAAGLELGGRGGIKTDAHMRTSDPAIFAVGDAVEVGPYRRGLLGWGRIGVCWGGAMLGFVGVGPGRGE